jgi:hypothetical protein
LAIGAILPEYKVLSLNVGCRLEKMLKCPFKQNLTEFGSVDAKLQPILERADGGTGAFLDLPESHDAKSPRSSSILARSTTSGAHSNREMFAFKRGKLLAV